MWENHPAQLPRVYPPLPGLSAGWVLYVLGVRNDDWSLSFLVREQNGPAHTDTDAGGHDCYLSNMEDNKSECGNNCGIKLSTILIIS